MTEYPLVWGIHASDEGYTLVSRRGPVVEMCHSWPAMPLRDWVNELLAIVYGPEPTRPPEMPRRIAVDQVQFGRATTDALMSYGLPMWSTAVDTRPSLKKRLVYEFEKWYELGPDLGPLNNNTDELFRLALYMTFVLPDHEVVYPPPPLKRSFWGT